MKNIFLFISLVVAAIGCNTVSYTKAVDKMSQPGVYPATFKQEMGIEVSEFRPIVKVNIKGQFYNFLIATEADVCCLDSTLASALGLQPIKTLKNEGDRIPLLELDKISIGNIVFSNVVFSAFDYREYNKLYNCLPVQGVIGVNLLKKGVWQIDYFNEKLTFANHRDSLFFPKNSKTITFYTYSNEITTTPIVPLRVNYNYICDAFIETGSSAAMDFPAGLLKNVLDTTKYLTWTGFGYCEDGLMPYSEKNYFLPKLNIGDHFDVQDVSLYANEGSLAHLNGYFLKDYVTTFDWSSKQITFLPNPKIDNSTFGFYPLFNAEHKVVVHSLIKNAPADKAGLKLNDQILKINDQDISIISLQDFCQIKNPYLQDTVTLSVKRNNEILNFVLPKVNFKSLIK